jgi:hypothetical protein
VQLYHSYCPTGEISKKVFTTLLKDAGVYDKELTQYDAEFTFDRAKATCLAPSSEYHDQVILNKRLTYQIFRLIVLPETARMKGQSIDRFVEVLVNGIPLEAAATASVKAANAGSGGGGANSSSKKP